MSIDESALPELRFSGDDTPGLGLAEAGATLQELASVFFPSGPAVSAEDAPLDHTAEELDLAARYQTLVEQIPAVVFLAFLDRGIGEAYVSPQIESLIGFSQQEWLNDPVRWYQQIHPDDKSRWSQEAAEMLLSGKPLRSTYRVIARDHRVVWFHCEAKMVRRSDGRPWFIHGVAFDVTELKEAEASLRQAHDELELRVIERTAALATANAGLEQEIVERKRAEQERAEMLAREQFARQQAEVANRVKDEFLATVSHELRTPLNAILGWVTLLRSSVIDKVDQNHALEVIERNARIQKQLIEDLLDVSRIITGKIRLELRPTDLNQIVENCVETVKPSAEAKAVSIQVSKEETGLVVLGDAGRLQQILWNLLSNALRFTPAGGQIYIELEQLDSQVVLTVRDTGIGISPQFLPFVFDRFRQADGSLTREQGGLGLGLAIVRHLAELHGGTVMASSTGKGEGATFKVVLPLLNASVTESRKSVRGRISEPQRLSIEEGPNFKDLRILVVDDDQDAAEMVATLLQKFGARVETAYSSAEALQTLHRMNVEVLISDIQMPGEHGFDLLKKVRLLEEGTEKPLLAIALTAHGRPEDVELSKRAGYQAHVTKPFEPIDLVAIIARLTGKSSNLRDGNGSSANETSATETNA